MPLAPRFACTVISERRGAYHSTSRTGIDDATTRWAPAGASSTTRARHPGLAERPTPSDLGLDGRGRGLIGSRPGRSPAARPGARARAGHAQRGTDLGRGARRVDPAVGDHDLPRTAVVDPLVDDARRGRLADAQHDLGYERAGERRHPQQRIGVRDPGQAGARVRKDRPPELAEDTGMCRRAARPRRPGRGDDDRRRPRDRPRAWSGSSVPRRVAATTEQAIARPRRAAARETAGSRARVRRDRGRPRARRCAASERHVARAAPIGHARIREPPNRHDRRGAAGRSSAAPRRRAAPADGPPSAPPSGHAGLMRFDDGRVELGGGGAAGGEDHRRLTRGDGDPQRGERRRPFVVVDVNAEAIIRRERERHRRGSRPRSDACVPDAATHELVDHRRAERRSHIGR